MHRWLWLPALFMLIFLPALPALAQEQPHAADQPRPADPTVPDETLSEEILSDESLSESDVYPEDFSDPDDDTHRPVAYSAFGEDESDPRVEWGGEPQVSE